MRSQVPPPHRPHEREEFITVENTAPEGATAQRPLLAFDGDCAFCQAVIQQIRVRVRPQMLAAPWQSLPEPLIRPHLQRLDREVLLLDGETALYGGAAALARFLGSSQTRRYRGMAFCLRLPVVSLLAGQIYRWVAVNRHRMPAGTAACALPRSPH
ncbi:thiol-disulfide oxidoreductase DCC family protein [Streptomyces sp. MMS24-I29]|uniref:thiol-disulfide oxidoreductase DCC family protein n=1 Tax=Streptomyces sp. MMS24-I29 TaxID=3351480 RepID=UPI003C7E50EC